MTSRSSYLTKVSDHSTIDNLFYAFLQSIQTIFCTRIVIGKIPSFLDFLTDKYLKNFTMLMNEIKFI